MAKTKGNSIVWLREYIKKHHGVKEQLFMASLDEEEKTIMQKTLAITWLPVDQVSQIFEKAAAVIYPHDKLGLRKLGRSQTDDQFSGMYSFFLKFISIPKLMERTARIWRVYHDCGVASLVLSDQPNELTMVLTDYPEYPDAYGENACGFIEKLIEKAGPKNPKVTYERTSPIRSEWSIKF